jgi:hypothetical protein
LGDKVLDAAHYHNIIVTGHWLTGSPSHGTVAVTIGLRDKLTQYRVPVDIQMQNERIIVTGMLHMKQTALGIKPLSILGGLLKVVDGVDLNFTLAFVPINKPQKPNPQ